VSEGSVETLDALPAPAKASRLTNQQILLGQKQEPSELIKLYSQDVWEEFIREWAASLRSQYREVRRASGAGDKGRDVVGYVDEINSGGPWDNFQCKHYDHALYPSDIWKELAKLCYYTFLNHYSMPRAYYFVAPRGVGPEVLQLLENPDKMKAGLVAQWEKGDLLKIAKKDISLDGDLRSYVNSFNFTIIKDAPPSRIIDGHRETRYHAARFGGGLVHLPPDKAEVPEAISDNESRYVEQLLQAYGDHLAQPITSLADLQGHLALKKHFDRQRTHFYLAELLRNFTRDNIPEDGCFERLQEAIFDGVVDIVEGNHANGFDRLKKTIAGARAIQIDSHPLKECLEGYHRSGVCHQLANVDRLKWVP
jgi:hypothetical protein